MSGTPRLAWIDAAKGIGVILVIIGHLHFLTIRPYIYAFHLPLFFFLSGYVFRTYASSKIFIQKKIKSLIYTYFWLFIIQFIFYLFYTVGAANITTALIWEKVSRFLIGQRFWALWFLTCLFLVEVIYYLLVRLIRSPLPRGLAVFALCVAGLTYYQLGGDALPWNLDASLTALPFFYLGHQASRLRLPAFSPHRARTWVWLLALAVICALANYLSRRFTGQGLEMYYSHYGDPPLVYLSALAGIGASVIVSQIWAPRWLQFIGRHSLVIFAWHQKTGIPLAVSFLAHFPALGPTKGLVYQTAELILVILIMVAIAAATDRLFARIACYHRGH